jgi:hypothetical protein
MKKKEPRRPLTLHLEQKAELIRFVQERFGSQNYATERDLLNFVEEKCDETLTYRWTGGTVFVRDFDLFSLQD